LCWGHRDECAEDPKCDTAGSFVEISTANYHGCGIRPNGTVSCWGFGATSSSCSKHPYHCGQANPPSGTFIDVSAGDYFFSCGVRSNKALTCWGAGGPNSSGFPHYGQSTPPSGTFTAVAAGESHACAIRTDGTIACWGSNHWGETSPPPGVFTQITAADDRNCGLRSDNVVICWGFQDAMTQPPATFP